MSRYGDREAYSPVSYPSVTRPDGSTFVQGDRTTYREIILDPVMPPAHRANTLEGVRRWPVVQTWEGRALTDAALWSLPAVGDWDLGPKTLADNGLYYLREVLGAPMPTFLRRLRSAGEGNGW